MTRFLGWKEFKEKVQSDIPTVLYENTNITTTFPNVDITTPTLPITLNQDCTKFKRLLVEGIVAIKNCNPTSTTTNLYDIFTTTDVINPEYGKMFALQDWFLYSDSTDSNDDHFAYCFRLVCKISDDGTKFNVYISTDDLDSENNDGTVRRSGWKRFGEVKNNYIDTAYQYGYPIAITKVIGFNNLK